MCGRYSASLSPPDLAAVFGIRAEDARLESWTPSWNVAPTDPVPAVLERHPRDVDGEPDHDVVTRQLRSLRWGLVPSWAKDAKSAARMINARAETVAEKPAYRKALRSRRCLLPADGYYEWLRRPGAPAQPFFIRRRDEPCALAGLYEVWRDPSGPLDAELLWTCTVVTTAASPAVSEIHDRMPVLLAPSAWDPWLDPTYGDADALRALLVPAPAEVLEAWPVSRDVGNVRNNRMDLTSPLPTG